MKRTAKSPLGARPRFDCEELRIDELKACIRRFLNDNWPIPTEFIEEYNELTEKLPKDD